jgi:hypothetical protein
MDLSCPGLTPQVEFTRLAAPLPRFRSTFHHRMNLRGELVDSLHRPDFFRLAEADCAFAKIRRTPRVLQRVKVGDWNRVRTMKIKEGFAG